jgi:hypothetical protein
MAEILRGREKPASEIIEGSVVYAEVVPNRENESVRIILDTGRSFQIPYLASHLSDNDRQEQAYEDWAVDVGDKIKINPPKTQADEEQCLVEVINRNGKRYSFNVLRTSIE